jgi:hypothetical protein
MALPPAAGATIRRHHVTLVVDPPPSGRRYAPAPMAEPTVRDIDALWGPATPQFAYQIADRIEAMIADLPAGHPVRRHGELRLAELDELGHGTTKGPAPAH